MTTSFIKLPVGVNTSSKKDIYFNPNLITTVEPSPDNTFTVIRIGGHDFMVRLPIEEVFKLIDK